jgi:hypothetical protein
MLPNEPTITLEAIMIAMPVAHREVMAVLRDRALEAERRITELESDIAFARQRIVDLENDVASHPPSVPSAAELDRPSATRDVAVAQKAFNGVCRMDKAHSESLNEMLHAQGVGIIVRQLTDRLVPTLTIKVTDAAFDTHVKTTVSKSDQRTRVDGFEFTWFSSGRGNLTSRACLQDGGRTLTWAPSRRKVRPSRGAQVVPRPRRGGRRQGPDVCRGVPLRPQRRRGREERASSAHLPFGQHSITTTTTSAE